MYKEKGVPGEKHITVGTDKLHWFIAKVQELDQPILPQG